jgi:hypothetical protein
LLAAVFLTGGCWGGGDEGAAQKKSTARKVEDPYPKRHFFHTKADAAPYGGPTPLKVQFTAAPFRNSGPVRYRWRFDDGTTSRQQNPGHTFKHAGTYTVVMDAKDQKGFNDRWSLIVGVWPVKVWNRRVPITARSKSQIQKLQRDQARRTQERIRKLQAAGLPTGHPRLKPQPGKGRQQSEQ